MQIPVKNILNTRNFKYSIKNMSTSVFLNLKPILLNMFFLLKAELQFHIFFMIVFIYFLYVLTCEAQKGADVTTAFTISCER